MPPLRLVFSATETPISKKKMLRCELPSRPSLASSRTPPLDQLRARRPDLAAVVDDIIAIYLEEAR
jgi:hypothetical protein